MRSGFSVLVVVAIAAFGSASCAHRASPRVVELHRILFGPIHPQIEAVAEAQMELGRAYADGRGTRRNVEFGCGLALAAHEAAEDQVKDEALRTRAQRAVNDLCAQVADREAALQQALCPVFGVKPQTFSAGSLGRLTLSPRGVRLTNDSGVHDDLWVADCGEIIMSPRIVRAKAAPGLPHVPTFLEFFLWRQMLLADGTPVPGRRLEWKVMEIVPWGLPQADGAVLRNYPGESVWPIQPVPRAIAGGRACVGCRPDKCSGISPALQNLEPEPSASSEGLRRLQAAWRALFATHPDPCCRAPRSV